MASHEYRYRGRSSSSQSVGNDPFWLLLTAALILCLVLVSLPAILVAFFAQRFTYRYLARFGWRWSAAIWLVLGVVGMLLLYNLMNHGLQLLMQREVWEYVQSGKHYQFDVSRWPLGLLWSETWPVWLRTFLVGVPLWGLWFELTANMRGRAGQLLEQREQDRQRTLRPERLPDAVADQMVMGVPVEGDEEHE